MYGYATVKVVPDYGETGEFERFLDMVNREGWKIEHVLPHDGKYFTFVYVYDDNAEPRVEEGMDSQQAEGHRGELDVLPVRGLPDA